MATFGEMLCELRQDSGMTQKELADKLYVTVGTISNYEHGVHLPDVEKLVELAEIFGVTTDYLLGRAECALSVDVLNEPILNGRSAGALIKDIQALSPDRQQALATMLEDMKISMVLERRTTQ